MLISPLNCLVRAQLPSVSPTLVPILVSSLVSLSIMHARGILTKVKIVFKKLIIIIILTKVDPVQISTPEIHWRLFGKHSSMSE